jgi:hypothetical protein
MSRLTLTYAGLLSALVLSVGVSSGSATEEETQAPAQSSYLLRSSVLGSAGSPGSSAGFQTNGTLGQSTPIGEGLAGENVLEAGFWIAWLRIPTGVSIPIVFENKLGQNYPNPFNPSTTIGYTVASDSPVQITIFNVKGQRVATLVDALKTPGNYNATWDGRNDQGRLVATGVYFYRLRVGSYSSVKKMVLLK